MAEPYVPLWCKSNASFLEGASHPEELVEEAGRLGLGGLALTDRDGLYGIVAAHGKAQELGLPLILGSQLTLMGGETMVLLVENHQGYRNLCRLISQGRRRSSKGQCQVQRDEVCHYQAGLLALLPPHPGLYRQLGPLQEAFGDRLYAMVVRHHLAEDIELEAMVREHRLPLVAAQEVLYHRPERRPLQDVLSCIRYGLPLARAGRRLRANGEHALKSPETFARLFQDLPQALEATLQIAARCRFSLKEIRYRYPEERIPQGQTLQSRLEQLTWQGALKRYQGQVPPAVEQQILKELELIAQLDFGGYFLTLHHIVEFCQRHQILCQGRGSAANSVVCYCLEITAVDPVKMGLLFERFLSLERAEPPDIDLDIAHQDRERVIQYVYEVYGRERAAMVANVIRYRPRSALRDVGKALGLEPLFCERLSKMMSHFMEDLDPQRLAQVGLDLENPSHRHLLRLSQEILGFPRHLSIHPGGFLLGHEPVSDLVPIENARMPGRTVIQWDKRDVEALGLFKVDLLGLGALSHLDRCFQLLAQHRGLQLNMANLPHDDPATFAMLETANSVGIFQIESRAQMTMLPRLRPRSYYDLVIQVSIVRPGPITGGMVHPYLRRRNGEEAVDYPHPCLEPILKKTLGIPLFQEQVIRLAMVAADYSGGEADQLRRDMGAWKSSGKIEGHRQKLVERMVARGIDRRFAERVFEQIRGFGEYGFPESHAASFALITYATAYLKCHYPAEFTCALLNSQPMGFYSPLSIVEDARRNGVVFRPLDVQKSLWDCTLEEGEVRMGLRYVKGLESSSAERLCLARLQGPFASLEELARRAGLERKALAQMARSGALDSLGKARRSQLWAVAALSPVWRDCPWNEPEPEPDLPALSPAESLYWDCQYSSHSLAGHPLSVWRTRLQQLGIPEARKLNALPHRSRVRYAGLVICRQRPETARGTTFFTLEDETGMVNVIVKPDLFEKRSVLARQAGLLGVVGQLESRQGVVHILAQDLFEPALKETVAKVASRDFH